MEKGKSRQHPVQEMTLQNVPFLLILAVCCLILCLVFILVLCYSFVASLKDVNTEQVYGV